MLDLLRERSRTTGELCEQFAGFSRFAVMKHLNVLQRANLLIVKREGKYRWNYINPVPIREIHDRWMNKYTAPLAASLLDLRRHVEAKSEESPMSKKMNAIQIELSISIDATQERIWQAITEETGRWWRKDFYAHPETRSMNLDARLGGHLFEDAGDGAGLVWATVIGIESGKSIDLAGHLSPAFGGPAKNFLKLELQTDGAATILRVSDAIFGYLDDSLEKEMSEGWNLLFAQGLKPYVEAAS